MNDWSIRILDFLNFLYELHTEKARTIESKILKKSAATCELLTVVSVKRSSMSKTNNYLGRLLKLLARRRFSDAERCGIRSEVEAGALCVRVTLSPGGSICVDGSCGSCGERPWCTTLCWIWWINRWHVSRITKKLIFHIWSKYI